MFGALATAVTTIALTSPAAVAAADPASGFVRVAPDPTSTSKGKLSLAVNPGGGIPQANAVITVAGSGYDQSTPLYVAVCAADTDASQLDTCIGGEIPDSNSSKAWGFISDTGEAPADGGVGAKWSADGAFTVTLTLPATDQLDCAKVGCAVFTHQQQSSSGDLSLGINFTAAAVTTSSSTKSSKTTTSLSSLTAATAVTVDPETIRASTIQAGAEQEVLFAGFTPGEKVGVTLFSEPIKLPDVTADSRGLVKITFKVPANLPAGTHLLQAVGSKSLVTGIARFAVTAAPTSSAHSAPSSAPSIPSSASAVVVPTTTSPQTVASSSVPGPTSSAAVVPPTTPATTAGNRPVWPWFGLGAILLIALGLLGWLVVRSRRNQLERENSDRERLLAEAAAANVVREAGYGEPDAPTVLLGGQPGPADGLPAGDYGLLSGRDHPDNPALLSGQGQPEPDERPTTYLPGHEAANDPGWLPGFGDPAADTGPVPTSGPDDGGPGTAQWRPDFAGDPEPDTTRWRPDSTGGDDSAGGGDPPETGGRHRQ